MRKGGSSGRCRVFWCSQISTKGSVHLPGARGKHSSAEVNPGETQGSHTGGSGAQPGSAETS